MNENKTDIIGAIERHALDHPGAVYNLVFEEGDEYRCRWSNGEYVDNGKELDSLEYEEWYVLDYEVIEVVKDGPNKDPKYDFITVSEKSLPALIATGDEVVYKV